MSSDAETAKLLKEQGEKCQKLLQSSGSSAKANNLINALQTTLNYAQCDDDCQRKKEEQQLLEKYQKAQLNLFNGNTNLGSTSKNYYTFSQGDAGYREFNEKNLKNIAGTISKKYSDMFHEIENTSLTLNNLYQSDFNNIKHANDLHNELLEKNNTLNTQVKNTLSDISTNDRKSYYEKQEYENIIWWYYLYLIIYWILVITFVISSFLVKSEYSNRLLLGMVIVMILYPFLAKYVVKWLIQLYFYILSFFPKNVYLSLNKS